MTKQRIYVSKMHHGYPGPGYVGPGWGNGYRCEWAIVVGDRVRRLRRSRDLTLVQLALMVNRPHGEGPYSTGYFSRLERGWASPPLYAYLAIAAALEVEPGRLLGPDDAEKEATDAEMTLVRLVRRLGLPVEEAIARIAARQAGARIAADPA
ncbi:MAG TPA: helix-turn-helix domain-containing protein [Thermoleophilaceae bacterium]|nr:helix-turn-helix domain-containing protein [Thermoleophilaceae bacterium]